MTSLSPLEIALLIVGVLSVFGLVAALIRHRTLYSQYEQFEADARSLTRTLSGELFRDGDDLVMSGNYGQLPAIVRFSNSDNTPGLSMRVQAPATFTLSVLPAAADATGRGRMVARTNDAAFDSRFTIRSLQPTEARMFLAPQTLATLKRLCCSTRTEVSVVPGAVEFSEMVIPETNTAHHITEHLKQISALVANLREMPGAEKVKVVPFTRERHVAARIAIAVGAVATLITVFTATGVTGKPQPAGPPPYPAGVMPVDAAAIRDVRQWRLAEADDFDGIVLGWLRGNRVTPEGRITGDFSGNAGLGDVAYFLLDKDGTRRVVLISQGIARYDAQFSSLGGIARLPKDDVHSITWAGGNVPGPIDGDGLLLVRNGADGTSAIALFLHGGNVVIGSPVKYDTIDLR